MSTNISKKRAYRSKVRRVTACTECHRRKQKCDRESPCNICSDRGVTERCTYRSGDRTDEYLSVEECHDAALDISEPNISKLSTQVGYVHNALSNSLSAGRVTALTELHLEANGHARPKTYQRSSPPPKLSTRQWTQLKEMLDELPPPEIVQLLIDVFFDEANWYFSVLDRYYFDKAHRRWSRSLYSHATTHEQEQLVHNVEDLYFPALLFQVLAMAMQFVPPELAAQHTITTLATPSFAHRSELFSSTGDAMLDVLGRRGHVLLAVQADVMRCAWLKNSGNGTEAWYSLGNAIRQAQDLGLHLQPSEPSVQSTSKYDLQTLWYNEHRRRLWVTLFTWEAHMALQLGRPRTINATDCTIRDPLDTNIPQDPSRTLFRSVDPDEECPSQYTASIVKYQLAYKIHKLLSVGALNAAYSAYATVLTIHSEAKQILACLPQPLRLESPDVSYDLRYPVMLRHRLTVHIIVHSFIETIHRPHIARHQQSLRAAVDAAKIVLDLSQRLFEITAKHQHKTYSLIFYTIDSGVLLAATMLRYAKVLEDREALAETLRQAVVRLSVLKERNAAAGAGEKVLRKCLSKVLQILPLPLPLPQLVPKSNMLTTNNSGSSKFSDPSDTPLSDASTRISTWDDPQTAFTCISDTPMANMDQSTESDRTYTPEDFDLFTQITSDAAFTSSWLSQSLDNFSSVDFDFATHSDSDFIGWNLFQEL